MEIVVEANQIDTIPSTSKMDSADNFENIPSPNIPSRTPLVKNLYLLIFISS